MPIFEYICLECKTSYEFLILTEDEIPICPECGSENAEKQVSAASFSLKGNGWYADGYSKATAPKKPNKKAIKK